MLRTYLNYVQNVLGAKSFILPIKDQEATETAYHFATPILNPEAKEILKNIIKALNAKKFDILELKIEKTNADHNTHEIIAQKASQMLGKSVLILFGRDVGQFLLPNTQIEFGQKLLISGSQTILTHSIEEMREFPELKREAWQHLKAFVNP